MKNVSYMILVILSVLGLWEHDGKCSPVIELQGQMQEQISNVIRGYDDNALVVVEVVPVKYPGTKLPGTNLVLEESVVTDGFSNIKIDRVGVVVFSTLQELPAEAKSIVKRIAASHTKNVKFELKPAAVGYVTPSHLKIAPVADLADAAETRVKVADWLSIYGRIMLAVLVLGVSVLCFLAFSLFKVGRQQTAFGKEILSAARSLVDAIESGGGGSRSESPGATLAMSSDRSGRYISSGDTDAFKEHSDESVIAMFSDAYWCQQDGFAAYLWRRLSYQRKQTILAMLVYGREYVSYLATVDEVPAGWEEHPCYMNPLPISFTDNGDLSQVVRRSPWLFDQLSPMRIANLTMDANEIISLRQQKLAAPDGWALSPRDLPRSPLRTLTSGVRIISRDDDDDRKLLNRPNAPITEVQQIVSLAWVMRMQPESVKSLLKGISARELADAWVGPPDVLGLFQSCLPERKLKLVLSYVERVTPSRQSAAYSRIHMMIVEALMEGTSTSQDKLQRSRQQSAA